MDSPRNNFEAGRAPVQDSTPTELSILTPTQDLQSVTTPLQLGPTTRSMTRTDPTTSSTTRPGPTTRSMTQTDPTIDLSTSITRSLNSMSTRLRRELRSLDMTQINSTNLMDHGLATGLTTGPNLPKFFSSLESQRPSQMYLVA